MARDHEHRQAGRGGGAGGESVGGAVPGKQTRVEVVVARAIAGGGMALPHAATIQRAFGRHDVSGVRAHLGPTAVAAAAALGAEAFAAGEHVVLGGAADLRTVAHEAAHVIQQRAGITAETDAHERHADEVAEAVVAGRSAEALLDRVAAPEACASSAPGAPGATVQRIKKAELVERGQRIAELAKTAPQRGINLWVARNDQLDAEIHLLGTGHGIKMADMGGEDAALRHCLVHYLQTEPFTHVYSETENTSARDIAVQANLTAALDKQRELAREHARLSEGTREYSTSIGKLSQQQLVLGGIADATLDDAYLHVATSTPSGGTKQPKPPVGTLETNETRNAARARSRLDLEVTDGDPESRFRVLPRPEETTDYGPVIAGDQRALFEDNAKEMTSGRDVAECEERNRQWIERIATQGLIARGNRQLWIVGAAHLGGLILRLQDLQWTVAHRVPPEAEPVAAPAPDETKDGGNASTLDGVD